jgi:uncharacterized protein
MINTAKIITVVYSIICILLYFFQEKLIFFPEKIAKDYKFQFNQKFEELNFKTSDDKLLNGILFKADSSKGLIFYLHGNAGSLKSWGAIAQTYTSLNYDLFLLDYRGYGKSEGGISSEKQFYNDVQLVYDILKKKYTENKIIILGYSIGTGPATKLASTNNAKLLILQAPYYSLTDIMHHNYPFVPTFILKYKFENYKFIKECKMPLVIFHGNNDEVIYYNSSIKLKALFKKTDTLIALEGQGHNNMSDNLRYQTELQKMLNR